MIFLGHVGITVGCTHAYNVYKKEKVDLRLAALLGIGPDCIDKPLGLAFRDFFQNNTRLIAHTLVWSIFLLSVAILYSRFTRHRKKSYAIIYFFAYFGHIILDRVNEWNKEIFFWPLLGPPPPLTGNIFHRWYEALFWPYSLLGETTGLLILCSLFIEYRLYKKKNMLSFFQSGLLMHK